VFMGIRYLNHYLKKECKQAIQPIHLKSLSGKKVAVDISIYLYKFMENGEESLIENLFTMLNLFRYYQIIPLFVFDGESPAEKKALLEKRREEKKQAEKAYLLLKETSDMDTSSFDTKEKREMQKEMDQLKKKFVVVNRKQIEMVKQLFDSYGVTYIVSQKEADEMCAYLVLKGDAWACLSEDMDMFVYGVPRVLRYLSLVHHQVVLYDLPQILNCLKMTQKELREICVLSGTDYSESTSSFDFYTILGWFKDYKLEETNERFYDWVKKRDPLFDDDFIEKCQNIQKRFEIPLLETENCYKGKDISSCSCSCSSLNLSIITLSHNLKFLLKGNGFLF